MRAGRKRAPGLERGSVEKLECSCEAARIQARVGTSCGAARFGHQSDSICDFSRPPPSAVPVAWTRPHLSPGCDCKPAAPRSRLGGRGRAAEPKPCGRSICPLPSPRPDLPEAQLRMTFLSPTSLYSSVWWG